MIALRTKELGKHHSQTTIRGLHLTAKEEFDLLLKWFGTESAELVQQIGAVHVNYLQQGLKMVWERLDDCYGASKVIENSLLRRVDSFPKTSNKDHQRLRELGHVLVKLQAAKLARELPGQAYA